MVTEAEAKINRVGPRHTLYLAKDLVEDSTFPFDTRQQLIVRVEGDRLIVEKPGRRAEASSRLELPGSESHPLAQSLAKLGFTPIVSKAQKMLDMLRDIHESEILEDNVRHMPRREHALYLWQDDITLERVLGSFLNPRIEEGAPKALLSSRPAILGYVDNLLSNELLLDGVRPEKRFTQWVSDIIKKNRTTHGTRVAMEDLSPLLEKYGQDTVLELENELTNRTKDNLTFLCGYRLSRIRDTELIEKLVSLHSYVILDNPLRTFRKE